MTADTAIYLIIDGSGSMAGVKNDVVKGINEYIDEQKIDAAKNNDVTVLTLTAFDTNIHEVYVQEDISLVNHVSTSDTFLGGGTSLLDAIGRTLTKAEDAPATKNLVVIYTDGQENASTEFKHSEIEDLIKKFDATGAWQFIYLGAEFADFEKDSANRAVAAAGTYSAMNTSKGKTVSTFKNLSQTSNLYRSATAQMVEDWAATPDGLIGASAAAGVDWEDVAEDKNE